MTALIFFGVTSVLSLFSLRMGLPALETGLLCALSAIAAAAVLYGLPLWQTVSRSILALATAAFACLSALIVMPALNLWPIGGGPLLFALIFAIVGTAARSRICLGLAVLALFGVMLDTDGLTRLRLDAQLATLALFSVGLVGSLLAGSRILASLSLVAIMLTSMTLLASFGVPTANALAVLSVFAVASTLALLAYLRRGYETAEVPAMLSILVAVITTMGYQLFLLGDVGAAPNSLGIDMPSFGVAALLGIQGMVLFVSLIQWFAGRLSITDVLLTQAVFGLVCTILADPTRLSRLGIGDPTLILCGFIALGLLAGSLWALHTFWKADRAALTSFSALSAMVQIILILRLLMGDFDIALAALVSASLAIGLAITMVLNPRKDRANLQS